MEADQGVAVAAFVGRGHGQLERRAAVGLGHHQRARPPAPRRGPPRAALPARPPAGRADRGRPDRIGARRRAPRRQRRASARTHLRLRAERREVGPQRPDRGGGAVHEGRRRGAAARAPRARARRSRRRGRARARRPPGRRGWRTAPRARGRRSAASPPPAAPAAAGRRSGPRSRASWASRLTGTSTAAEWSGSVDVERCPGSAAASDVGPRGRCQRRTGGRAAPASDVDARVRTRSPTRPGCNDRARALYERHGFEVEGPLRGYVAGEGALRDVWIMGRLRPALERADASGRDRVQRVGAVRGRAPPSRAARARVARAPGRPPAAPRRSARAPSSSSASSGSRATRNWARPDWRVPSISPSPRSSRSISASLKPSRSSASARSRGDSFGPEQHADRLVRPAADPPAELVQLRDAVALGALDEHHRRVRDVDPHLDHRRGHEHVRAARRERGHRLLLLARLHLPVQEHDAEVAQLGRAQPLVLRGRRARLQRLGLLHERADDERLAPRRAAPRGSARRRGARSRSVEATCVWIGCRPAGRWRSTVTSRSP